MQVYKFGGASIATPGRVHALLPIITDASKPLVLVISALGKTTNALERIVELATNGQHTQALIAANDLIAQHQQYAAHLGVTVPDDVALQPLFEQLRTLATIADGNRFDYWYDQIVSLGELFSTTIIAAWLKQHTPTAWADARTFIATDDNYRDAGIDWERSAGLVQQQLAPLLAQGAIVVTQGFIGATATGASVTLGREGSDYTAAVIAAMLEAERVTIWKDVAGLLNADPKMFADTVLIPAITYREVIEMAYYGAQVIHPKTIKPLQNNGIPLYVKCFLDPTLPGTVICEQVSEEQFPPLIVRKDNQVLLQVTTRDFSFITENNLSHIYSTFHLLKVHINLIQNAAISFTACVDNDTAKIEAIIERLTPQYYVKQNGQVSLLTMRHATRAVLAKHAEGAQILLQQETRKTVQAVLKYE